MAVSDPPQAASVVLVPGATFNRRYEVVRCIKAGGMGAVYEVVHRDTRRRRALKTMLPSLAWDAEFTARFKLEATIAAEIDSQHIVEVVDAGVDDETRIPFIVMELLKGEELGEALERQGRFTTDETLVLLEQAAFALDRTHRAGIIHRDLKPENLFLSRRDDGSAHLKLLDFGIAKIRVTESAAAKTTLGVGSPLYMAPEQIRGEASLGPEADLYSLAHIAFTLLTGRPYWEPVLRRGSVYALLVAKADPSAAHPSASARAAEYGMSLPAGFDAWFATATAVEPEQRFASASDLVRALTVALDVPHRPELDRPHLADRVAQAPEGLATLSVAKPGSEVASATERALVNATDGAVIREVIAPARRWRRRAAFAALGMAAAGALVYSLRRAERAVMVPRAGSSDAVTEHPAPAKISVPSMPSPSSKPDDTAHRRVPANASPDAGRRTTSASGDRPASSSRQSPLRASTTSRGRPPAATAGSATPFDPTAFR